MSAWLLLSSPAAGAAFNMALDEALLEALLSLSRPVLRFYSWTERAGSFGYFQKHAEIARLTSMRPLVRRPTGGGLVLHDADWTYSLAFPVSHGWYSLKAIESYRGVHLWIQAAFARLEVATELALHAGKGQAGQCFIGHEQFDLLWRGRKIAGAAQRRRRDGLLIQGSVQAPSPALSRANWERAMTGAARTLHGAHWEDFLPDASLLARAQELADQKYSQAAYNGRR